MGSSMKKTPDPDLDDISINEKRESGRPSSNQQPTSSLTSMIGTVVRDEFRNAIEMRMAEFVRTENEYITIRDLMTSEMDKGLSKRNNKRASVKMHITPIGALPNGTETGTYLSLNVGTTGTTLIILSVTLQKKKKLQVVEKVFPISDKLLTSKGSELFSYMATCMAHFLSQSNLNSPIGELPLGFTFSYPLLQKKLDSAVVIKWTKEINCGGVVGSEVGQLLRTALRRNKDIKSKIKIIAVMNDTAACLAYGAYSDYDAMIGAVIDDGFNACYLEKMENAQLWTEPKSQNMVAINTEWGAFGDDGCLNFMRTRIDKELDGLTMHPSSQTYEKMISGSYLGLIVGQLIIEFTKQGYFFLGKLPVGMAVDGKLFSSKHMSMIEQDSKGRYKHTRRVLTKLGFEQITDFECELIYVICHIVSDRAACLAAAGFSSLLNRIDLPNMTIAIDGAMFREHQYFGKRMQYMTKKLIKNSKNEVKFKDLDDGCAIGSALVAAAEYRRLGKTGKNVKEKSRISGI